MPKLTLLLYVMTKDRPGHIEWAANFTSYEVQSHAAQTCAHEAEGNARRQQLPRGSLHGERNHDGVHHRPGSELEPIRPADDVSCCAVRSRSSIVTAIGR
eukprot:1444196-Pleurochrysis_carterae.AAC.6